MTKIAYRIPGIVLAAAIAAAAQCALHDAAALFSGGPAARLGLIWRETALSAAPGTLSELDFSARVPAGPHFDFGLRWSFAVLDIPAGTGAGLGDPAVEIGAHGEHGAWTLGGGAQMSAPLGDEANGLGSGDFMAAGWFSALFRRDAWSAGALAGIHSMAGADPSSAHARHIHAPATLGKAYAAAHPHSDLEMSYRAEGTRRFGRWGFSLAVDGAHVLGTAMGVAGGDFIEGEAGLGFASAGAAWKPSLRFPLSADRRADWVLGVGVEKAW